MFDNALHLLSTAVGKAQEAIFNDSSNPDLWLSDATPHHDKTTLAGGGTGATRAAAAAAQASQERRKKRQQQEELWTIGTVAMHYPDATDREVTAGEEKEEESEDCKAISLRIDDNNGENEDGEEQDDATSSWKAFDDAFSVLSIRPSTTNTAPRPPAWAATQTAPPLSLHPSIVDRLTVVPGTHLHPMSVTERQRCETLFRKKGYERGGGVGVTDAEAVFTKCLRIAAATETEQEGEEKEGRGVSGNTTFNFRSFWCLANTTGAGALDVRQFCVFVALLKAVVEKGAPLPDQLSALQAAQLLGDVPVQFCDGDGDGGSNPIGKLDTGRLKDLLATSTTTATARGKKLAEVDVSGGETTRYAMYNEEAMVYSSEEDYDDDEGDNDGSEDDSEDDACSISSYIMRDSPSGTNTRPSRPKGLFSLPSIPISLSTPRHHRKPPPTHSSSKSSLHQEKKEKHSPMMSQTIPRLPFTLASLDNNETDDNNGAGAATDRSNNASTPTTIRKLERAVWEAEAGQGHSWLELRLLTAAIMQRKHLDHPFMSLTVRDPVGRLVELPQDSHPGLYSNNAVTNANGVIDFNNQALRLTTHLRSLPPGCLLFLELKQWKAEKKRFSTVCWTFVDVEMMVDSGAVCSRVRCGPMVLPLFKKPVDMTLQRLKRFNGKGPGLHVVVRGVC